MGMAYSMHYTEEVFTANCTGKMMRPTEWEDNIKIHRKAVWFNFVNWFYLAQKWTFVDTVLKFWTAQKLNS
jgi:hypothetical protein